jgi:hypothetical protein
VAAQPPLATRDRDGNEIVRWPAGVHIVDGRDTASYGANAFWPASPVRLLDTGKMRKWQMARLGVPLAIYNPVTGALSKLSQASAKSAGGSGQPPQFLSTHPSHESRIREIEANLPKVLPLYLAARKSR